MFRKCSNLHRTSYSKVEKTWSPSQGQGESCKMSAAMLYLLDMRRLKWFWTHLVHYDIGVSSKLSKSVKFTVFSASNNHVLEVVQFKSLIYFSLPSFKSGFAISNTYNLCFRWQTRTVLDKVLLRNADVNFLRLSSSVNEKTRTGRLPP